MLEHHGSFNFPPDDAVLWRFMDFTKFVSLLQTRRLYFSVVAAMEDPFEGAFTRRIVEGNITGYNSRDASKSEEDNYRQYLKDLEDMRKNTCLSCWHMNEHESAAMWKLYLKSDEGIAIKTTFRDMAMAFEDTEDEVFAAIVNYINYDTDEYPLNNAFFPLLHKRKSFAHEAEMRLLWWYGSDHNRKVIAKERPFGPEPEADYTGRGRSVPVNLKALLQHVYVAPNAQRWFLDVVGASVADAGLTCRVTQSDLLRDPVW
jgi:hypothetical protein